jgi:uncharacterized protein
MSEPVTGDAVVRRVLSEARVFGVVGASSNPARASYYVSEFLLSKGFKVVPINPGLAGQELLGQKVYATLADVPGPIDVVDIFRNSEAALEVTRAAIAERQRLKLKAIWMQLDVINDVAAKEAEAAGLSVVMDRCPKIELGRG